MTTHDLKLFIRRLSPVILIPCGIPFSGKSTLSQKLSIDYEIKVVSFDSTWQELEEHNKDLDWDSVSKHCELVIKEEISGNRSIVYDTYNSTNAGRNYFAELAKSLNCNYLFVYLHISEAVARKRMNMVKQNMDRHLITEQKFNQEVEIFEAPSVNLNHIILDNL